MSLRGHKEPFALSIMGELSMAILGPPRRIAGFFYA
jgi:hypothetical protein